VLIEEEDGIGKNAQPLKAFTDWIPGSRVSILSLLIDKVFLRLTFEGSAAIVLIDYYGPSAFFKVLQSCDHPLWVLFPSINTQTCNV
jgi:hypothetical protein